MESNMNEAVLILPNMRGGCATVGNTVHTLFRITSRRPRRMTGIDEQPAVTTSDCGETPADSTAKL
jgi:hypothetical protein